MTLSQQRIRLIAIHEAQQAVRIAATVLKDALVEAVSKRKDLRGANLRGAYLTGAYLTGAYGKKKEIHAFRAFSGLYCYEVHAVLFEDGERWVRMGCLWYSLEKWESIGIRNSNVSEFPNDGSDRCEERVAAFEFAKAAVLRMKMPMNDELFAD